MMHVSVTNLVTVYVGDKFEVLLTDLSFWTLILHIENVANITLLPDKINYRLKLEYLIKYGEPRMLLTSCDKSIVTVFIVRHFE